MNIRELQKELELDEGIKYVPYICSAGYNSIGIGHNIDDEPLSADMIHELAKYGALSVKSVQRLFEKDVQDALIPLRQVFPAFDTFQESRQHALINMCFNMGATRLLLGKARFRKMIAAINAGDWERAAAEAKDSLWWRQKTVSRERKGRVIEKLRGAPVTVVPQRSIRLENSQAV